MLSMTDRWPLLVLDEPTAGLDAGGVARLVTDLERMSQTERAIALITHDMDLALRLCPRCVVVGDGRLLSEGPTRKLLSDSSLLARSGLAEPSRAAAARWLTRVSQCSKDLNPLTKLAVSLTWLMSSMLVIDGRFQIACILLPSAALILLNLHVTLSCLR